MMSYFFNDIISKKRTYPKRILTKRKFIVTKELHII